MEINKEWLIAIRWMLMDIKGVLEENQKMLIEDRYDEEFFLPKINNIIDNFDNKIKELSII